MLGTTEKQCGSHIELVKLKGTTDNVQKNMTLHILSYYITVSITGKWNLEEEILAFTRR